MLEVLVVSAAACDAWCSRDSTTTNSISRQRRQTQSGRMTDISTIAYNRRCTRAHCLAPSSSIIVKY